MASNRRTPTFADAPNEDAFDASNLEERLAAIAAFLPVFENPAFTFGKLERGTRSSEIVEIPAFSTLKEAESFVRTAYEAEWVYPFSWTDWVDTDEAKRLRNDPSFLAQADERQLAKLLTASIRADRFCDGALATDYETGLLTNILRRAAALLAIHRSAT
ncbi:DUF6508 domain-containing protein [Acidiphilium sp.]|uniref:DUF6508 domain-containing protein n=1 Tax=Acidiphilium sp. TaxID=527 RepID=UPI002588C9D5|nr:DUF6508 domain-containing protein [Acidiphilium sp.]